jgi:hypothetical protein
MTFGCTYSCILVHMETLENLKGRRAVHLNQLVKTFPIFVYSGNPLPHTLYLILIECVPHHLLTVYSAMAW